jgi:hypothetical protein
MNPTRAVNDPAPVLFMSVRLTIGGWRASSCTVAFGRTGKRAQIVKRPALPHPGPLPLGIGIYTSPLSPRGTSGERARERGNPQQKRLLSPTLSSFLRQEEREKIRGNRPFLDLCRYQCPLGEGDSFAGFLECRVTEFAGRSSKNRDARLLFPLPQGEGQGEGELCDGIMPCSFSMAASFAL